MPTRVKLSREKGWRMPPNTRKVDRSTAWGNPFAILESYPASWFPTDLVARLRMRSRKSKDGVPFVCVNTAAQAVELFRWWVYTEGQHAHREAIRVELNSKNLACWCGEHQPCHADVLLEIANAYGSTSQG